MSEWIRYDTRRRDHHQTKLNGYPCIRDGLLLLHTCQCQNQSQRVFSVHDVEKGENQSIDRRENISVSVIFFLFLLLLPFYVLFFMWDIRFLVEQDIWDRSFGGGG